jgi:hypothetical protein
MSHSFAALFAAAAPVAGAACAAPADVEVVHDVGPAHAPGLDIPR